MPRNNRRGNPSNKHTVNISITIPLKVLTEIEEKGEGKNRSQKICNALMKTLQANPSHNRDRAELHRSYPNPSGEK